MLALNNLLTRQRATFNMHIQISVQKRWFVFIILLHNVINCNKSILVHFRSVFVFIESSDKLLNIMLNINAKYRIMEPHCEVLESGNLY